MIRVMIADNQTLMRDGLETILNIEEDIKVVASVSNGNEVLDKIRSNSDIDVLLLDIRMPEMDGLECLKCLNKQHSKVKVLILTTFNDEEYITEVLANGACGYILKDTPMEKLVNAIRDVYNDKFVIPKEVAVKLAGFLSKLNLKRKTIDNLELSGREIEIASMLVQGFTNDQISVALYLSKGTTRNYISNIYNKIGVSDRANAVLYLKDKGL